MSGIVGIVNLDQAPVDRELLNALTAKLSMRGPDAQAIWTEASVGLGHAMLRTRAGVTGTAQPHTLDGKTWIVADARIDARDLLIAELNAPVASAALDDPELILLAYRKWGTDCVRHLLGDFSFAIWDTDKRALLCARDHFGVRPFYYTRSERCFVFSNDLDTLRLHPAVSAKLNDIAILNFLIFRYQPRVDQTTFADIAALPAAARLQLHDGRVDVEHYWTLPIEEPFRFRKRSEFVEGYREVLASAVADRSGFDRAGILLSGGMDSTSIAAALTCLCHVPPRMLTAFTYGYTSLIPDPEPHYAKLVANRLRIDWRFLGRDNEQWFEGWDRPDVRFPEPVVTSPLSSPNDGVRLAALNEGIRVFFCGWGPDLMLRFEPSYYLDSLRELEPLTLLRSIIEFLLRYHRRPPLNIRGARRRWRSALTRKDGLADDTITPLLSADFAGREDLPTTWRQYITNTRVHPRRRVAYDGLTNHFWTLAFGNYDAANWGAPIEFRYPYFDVRVVRYFLRVPVLPWCSDKALMREAMRGLLPAEVLARPKTPVAAEPAHAPAPWVSGAGVPGPQLSKYVIAEKARQLLEQFGTNAEMTRRLVALDHWMEHCAGATNSTVQQSV